MTSLTNERATRPAFYRLILGGAALVALSACVRDASFDSDLRGFGKNTFSTADAALQANGQRPEADARGIISYPGYQVAVARQGDTVESVAARVGIPAGEIAQYNALQPGVTLRQGEIVALPRRVGAAPAGTGLAGTPGAMGAPGAPGGAIDVTTIASGAIDRATGTAGAAPRPATPTTALPVQSGPQPARHRVERGETAYTIARMYNVNVKALADWNGLGSDLAVREGQTLLIPLGASATGTVAATGAAQVLPPVAPAPVAAKPPALTQAPVTPAPVATTAAGGKKPAAQPAAPAPAPVASAGGTQLSMPVQGKIIRGYQKKKNDGIDIAAAAGTAVAAAGDGTVAAITKNTNGVPIVVIRHGGNLLTVYANLDGITVKKGDAVRRGQKIATVRASDPAFVHFEVRQGMESVDPASYL